MFYLVLQTTQVVEIVTSLFVFHIHLQFSNKLQTYKLHSFVADKHGNELLKIEKYSSK